MNNPLQVVKSQVHRPPGRPRRSPEREAEIRGRVANIAARLFRDEGLAAVSMRRIASEAQVSPMSLYDYFRSKNEIIRAIWERFFSECFELVESAAARCKREPRRKLEAACVAYVRYWLDHPDEYRAVFMIEDKIENRERYFVETSAIITRYQIFSDLLNAHQPGSKSNAQSDRAAALICALTGVCHMLVTVSEFRWPAATQLLKQLMRMVD
ncbi:MAG TPA: TetR/AcrR family transcriptional regulator [Steroidobacteraceae bacterium]